MRLFLAFVVGIIFLFPHGDIAADSPQGKKSYSLFSGSSSSRQAIAPSSEWAADNPRVRAATRYRNVDLIPQIAENGKIQAGDQLVLDLFPGVSYRATVDRAETNISGVVAIRARLQGSSAGYLTLSTSSGKTLGTIVIPEQKQHFAILFDPGTGSHFLLDVDPRKAGFIESSPVLIPPSSSPQPNGAAHEGTLLGPTLNAGPDDPAIINVMVLYTPAAESWADTNEGGIKNAIDSAMSKAQLVCDNSGALVTMRLAHSAEVTYVESGSQTDLERLTGKTDGYMDEIHAWRDEYGADLVTLYTFTNDTGGLGWLLNSIKGFPDYAFCLVRVQQASWTYTHIHEMGHNSGLHHHKQQNVQPGPTVWQDWAENTWSAGWRWTGNDNGKYCDVMTYSQGSYFPDGVDHIEVPYFSSPLVNYQGVATGDAADGDNARTFKEIKHVIAAYRSGGPTTYKISGTITGDITEGVTLTLTGTSSATTASKSGGTYSFTGLSNGSYTITPSFESCTFEPVSQSVTITDADQTGVNFVSDEIIGPRVSVSATTLSVKVAKGHDADPVSFQVWNSGDSGTVSFTVTDDQEWMSCVPTSGSSQNADEKVSVEVRFTTSQLEQGTYSGTITVTAPGATGSPVEIPVILNVQASPHIALDSDSPNWSYDAVAKCYVLDVSVNPGSTATPESFRVYNDSQYATVLNFFVSDDSSWLVASPTSGNSTGPNDRKRIDLVFQTDSLSIGKYTATLNISDLGATNSPQKVRVELTVGPADEITTEQLDLSLLSGIAQTLSRDSWNRIGFWGDASGMDNNALQKSVRKQPLMIDAVCGSAVLRFDGRQSMSLVGSPFPHQGSRLQESVVFAFRTGSDLALPRILFDSGCSKVGINAIISGGALFANTWSFVDPIWESATLSAPLAPETFYVLVLVLDGKSGTYSGWLNGDSMGSMAGIGSLGSSSEGMSIGGPDKTTFVPEVVGKARCGGFVGEICDVFLYGKSLSDAERVAIESYLANRHALSFEEANRYALWLRASSGAAVADSSVFAWGDRSSSNVMFTQRNRSLAPSFTSQTRVGAGSVSEPSVLFNGESSFLRSGSSVSINSSRTPYDQKSFYVVFGTSEDIVSPQAVWSQGDTNAGLNICVQNGELVVNAWNQKSRPGAPAWGVATVAGAVNANSVYYLQIVFDPSDSGMTAWTRNLGIPGSVKTLLGQSGGTGAIFRHRPASLGSVRSSTVNCGDTRPGSYFKGAISEILMYNGVLDDANVAIVEAYLFGKYTP